MHCTVGLSIRYGFDVMKFLVQTDLYPIDTHNALHHVDKMQTINKDN